jgi:RHS repeat-associated protein
LSPGSLTGRALLSLDQAYLIQGAELILSAPSGTVIEVMYESDGKWRNFAGGHLKGPATGRVLLDLSYERAQVTALSVDIRGEAADQVMIGEIHPIGEPAARVEHRIRPVSISSTQDDKPFYRAENLIDDKPWTSWGEDASTGFDFNEEQAAISAIGTLTKQGHGPKHLDDRWNASSLAAQLTLPGNSVIDTVRLHFLPNRRGDLILEVLEGTGWRTVARINEDQISGWRSVRVDSEGAREIRVGYAGSKRLGFRGLSEVEIWGKGLELPTKEGEFLGIAAIPDDGLNATFSADAVEDKALEFDYEGGEGYALKVSINGKEHSALPIAAGGGNTLYRIPISAEELWKGDNYLRIFPRKIGDQVRFARTAPAAIGDGVQVFGLDAAWDGCLLTPGASQGDKIYALGRKVSATRIEAYSTNGFFPTLSIRMGDVWSPLVKSLYDEWHCVYVCDSTIDSLKVEASGSNLSEIRIIGSPTTDQAPQLQLLSPFPDGFGNCYYDRNQLIIGFVDNPDVTVKANGKTIMTKGHLFWVSPESLRLTGDDIETVTIVASDDRGRSTTRIVEMVPEASEWISFNQDSDIVTTATSSLTLSGSVHFAGALVSINGIKATMTGSRFSATIALREGYNLIPIVLTKKSNGKVIATIYRKALRSSSAPTITICAPQNMAYTHASFLMVEGTILGAGPLLVTVNGKSAEMSGGSFLSGAVSLSEGANTITVTASDGLKRSKTETIMVYRDTIAPIVKIGYPQENAYLSACPVTILGSSSDTSPTWILVNGKAVPLINGSFSIVLPFRDGSSTVLAQATDAAGNVGKAQISYTTDTVPPADFSLTLSPPGWCNSSSPTLSFSTTDATSGIDHYELSVDGAARTCITSPYRLPALADGFHSVNLIAYDRALNAKSASIIATIDTVAPPPPPDFKLIPGNETIHLGWGQSSADTLHYEISRMPVFAEGGSITLTGLSYDDADVINGQKYLYLLRAVDRAGNASQDVSNEAICGLTTAPYSPEMGATVKYDDVQILIPPESLPAEISAIRISEVESSVLNSASGNIIIGPMLHFSASTVSGGSQDEVADLKFSKPFECSIVYDPALLPPTYSESSLSAYYYDTMWGQWFRIGTSKVDTERNVVSFSTDHFTDFSIQPTPTNDLSPQELAGVPYSPYSSATKHEAISISPQGGSVATSMTEVFLPGPNGFDFTLRRTYDTSTARRDAQNYNLMSTVGTAISVTAYKSLMTRLDSGQLIAADENLATKIAEARIYDGDYGYSMGRGWRLDLPYIRKDESEFIIRMPSGGEYSINSHLTYMETIAAGNTRSMHFELHEGGEDFSLYADQTNIPIPVMLLWVIKLSETESWTTTAWRLYAKDGTCYTFGPRGELVSIINTAAHMTRISYSPDGRISKITDSRGREFTFAYSSTGGFGLPYISKVTAPNGSAIYYVQSGKTGKLNSATDIGSRTYSYAYSADFYDDSMEYVALLANVSGPGIGSSAIGYENRRLTPTDSAYRSSYRFVATELSISTNGDAATPTRKTSYSQTFVYQGKDQFIVQASTVADGRKKTCYSYSAISKSYTRLSGKINSTDAESNQGTLVETSIPLLDTVTTYDQASNMPLETTTFRYDGERQLTLSETQTRLGGMERKSEYGYDSWGNVSYQLTTELAGAVTTTMEILTSFTIAGNAGTSSIGKSKSTAIEDSPSEPNPPSLPSEIHALPYRRIETASSDPKPRYTTWFYDDKGRPTRKNSYSPTASSWKATKYEYDNSWGEVSKIVYPDNHVVTIAYDSSTHIGYVLATKTEKDVADADGAKRDITSLNVQRLSTGNMEWESDGRGYVTSYIYDNLGRIITVEKPADSDTEGWNPGYALVLAARSGNPRTLAVYDDTNMTVVLTDPSGSIKKYTFDALGRLGSIEQTMRLRDAKGDLVSGSAIYTTTVAYDKWDNISRITDPRSKSTTYEYDSMGRLTKTSHPYGSRTMSYDYGTGILVTTDELGNTTMEQMDWRDRSILKTKYDGTRYVEESSNYDGFGKEISRTIRNQSIAAEKDTTSWTYDEEGNTQRINYPSLKILSHGASTTTEQSPSVGYEYDERGRRSAEVVYGSANEIDHRTDYELDAVGNITKQTRTYTDYSTSPTGQSARAITKYYYDDAGNKTKEIDPNGKTKTWTYSARGKILSEISPGGATTLYAYDSSDRLSTLTDPRASALGDEAFSIEYRYDDAARLIVGILPGRKDARPMVRLEYDSRGNLFKRHEPDGGLCEYAYDDENHLVEEKVTATSSDGSSRFYTTTHSYDAAGNETETKDGLGNATTKNYDPFRRLVCISLPDGSSESYGYDWRGNRTSLTDGRGNTYITTYDALGRPRSTFDALGNGTRADYDIYGNLTRRMDEKGFVTSLAYDEMGRLLVETRPDASERHYAYDAVGNLHNSSDPRGILTIYSYDEDYRLTLASRSLSGRTETTSYSYDLAGGLKSAQDGSVSAIYNTNSGVYSPDPYGRVNRLERKVGAKSLAISYSYDNLGRITDTSYPDGRLVNYNYDSSGRLESVPDYVQGPISYDLAGRISSLSAKNGMTTNYSWDSESRLSGLSHSSHGSEVAAFSFSYDRAGNIIKKNDSSYGYDRLNRLSRASEIGRFSTDTRITAKPLGTKAKDYSGQGSLSFDGNNSEIGLDSDSISIGVSLGKEVEVSRIELFPKATVHRIKARNLELLTSGSGLSGSWQKHSDLVVESRTDGTIVLKLRMPVSARYVKLHCYYDDRAPSGDARDAATFRNAKATLMKVDFFESRRDEDYTYDAKGNREKVTTSMSGATVNSSYSYYPNTDWLLTDGSYAYTYDANGNLVEKGSDFSLGTEGKPVFSTSAGSYTRYEYDLQNRMVAVHRGEAGSASATIKAIYTYGPDGLLCAKTSADGTTYYVYGVDGNKLSEISAESDIDTVWAMGKKLAEVAKTPNSTETRTYLATDQVGTVVAATDETGKLIWQGCATAFGIDSGQVGITDRILSFTGKDFDKDAGLTYFNARWYDPTLGRFITEDPARDDINWYAYCQNRPLTLTDPDGERPEYANGLTEAQYNSYTHNTYESYAYQLNKAGGTLPLKFDEGGAIADNTIFEVFAGDATAKFAINAGKSLIAKATAYIAEKVATAAADTAGTIAESAEVMGQSATEAVAGRVVNPGKDVANARRSAVKAAWKDERNLVQETGNGTRQWTEAEKNELLKTGKVADYEGHHINNVADHPDMARDPNNIEFLMKPDHLGAHGGNFRNPTTGSLLDRTIQ